MDFDTQSDPLKKDPNRAEPSGDPSQSVIWLLQFPQLLQCVVVFCTHVTFFSSPLGNYGDRYFGTVHEDWWMCRCSPCQCSCMICNQSTYRNITLSFIHETHVCTYCTVTMAVYRSTHYFSLFTSLIIFHTITCFITAHSCGCCISYIMYKYTYDSSLNTNLRQTGLSFQCFWPDALVFLEVKEEDEMHIYTYQYICSMPEHSLYVPEHSLYNGDIHLISWVYIPKVVQVQVYAVHH